MWFNGMHYTNDIITLQYYNIKIQYYIATSEGIQ